jgi:hypothetical protein
MRWLALLLLFGCGDNLAGITLEQRYHLEVAARCKQLARCGLFADEASCVAFTPDRADAPLAGAVAAGVVSFNPTVEQECLDAVAAVSCDQTSRSFRVRPLSCQGALLGTRNPTQECRFDSECTTARCQRGVCEAYECCQGACKSARTASGPCDNNADCFDGRYCSADHVCAPLEHELAVCTADSACDFGLACVSGTCRKLPAIGQPCPYSRCADLGARCSAGACIRVGLAGDACSTDEDCSPYAPCDQMTGRCAAIPTLGMPCTSRCGGNSACVGGTCMPPLEDSTPCTTSSDCQSGLCAEGALGTYVCMPAPTCF